MARKLIRRFIPSAQAIKNTPALHFLGDVLHDPNLFHLNRHSVSVAFFVGIFVAFLPLPGQMPLAAGLALLLRCNLPISVALVWISNPITMPAIFFATYQLGRVILDVPPVGVSLELNLHWLAHEFSLIWKPLLVGSILSGTVFGILGYVTMRLFWRWTVVKSWQRRKWLRSLRGHRKAERTSDAQLALEESELEPSEPVALNKHKLPSSQDELAERHREHEAND